MECLAQLLRTVGSYLDPQPQRGHGRRGQQQAPATAQAGWMDAYFVRINAMSQSAQLDSRLRFMLKVRGLAPARQSHRWWSACWPGEPLPSCEGHPGLSTGPTWSRLSYV